MLNQDLKSFKATPRSRRLHKGPVHLIIGVAIAAGIVAITLPTHDAEAKRDEPVTAIQHIESLALSIPPLESDLTMPDSNQEAPPKAPSATIPSAPITTGITLSLPIPQGSQPSSTLAKDVSKHSLTWREVEVKSGDSLSLIFDRNKIAPAQMMALLASDKRAKELSRNLQPGKTLRLALHDGELQVLDYPISAGHSLRFTREGDRFLTVETKLPIEKRLVYASGTIENSLYDGGTKAGLSDRMIMQLVAIFGWDIDFALDIRKGDHFSLLYEELYLRGEKLRNGEIVAAEFTNQGRDVQAIRYTDGNGNSNYYNAAGLSMRKAFLRSPVDFHRISSRFSGERYHPVLGKKRPHKGVDYAAKTGTPIKSAGDGKVIFRGTKGGYGRTVVIQHGGKYTTLYAHMSSHKRGLHVGSRVKQGQVIGFVGKSGLATGPHLHYEFRINGAHRNPLTVALPNASPIQKAYRDDFIAKAVPLLAQLDRHRQVRVAQLN